MVMRRARRQQSEHLVAFARDGQDELGDDPRPLCRLRGRGMQGDLAAVASVADSQSPCLCARISSDLRAFQLLARCRSGAQRMVGMALAQTPGVAGTIHEIDDGKAGGYGWNGANAPLHAGRRGAFRALTHVIPRSIAMPRWVVCPRRWRTWWRASGQTDLPC